MNAVQALSAAIEWSKPMAGNADVNSTADDDFLLLYDVRALVAQRTHSFPEAERLITEFAQRGHFTKCSYRGDRYIPPGQWGVCVPKLGLLCPIDFDNSTVSYVYEGPPSDTAKLVWEDVWEDLEKFAREEREKWEKKRRRRRRRFQGPISRTRTTRSFLPPPFFQMTLVGLARDEVLSMLRKAGLLRPSVGELQAAEEPDIAAIEAAVVAAGTLSQLPTLELSASPEAKAQSLSQLTEDQIQKLMGDVSKLSATEKRLRRYTIIKHREHWKSQDPGRVKTASEKDPLYEKEVVGIHYGISTWRRALGRKK